MIDAVMLSVVVVLSFSACYRVGLAYFVYFFSSLGWFDRFDVCSFYE